MKNVVSLDQLNLYVIEALRPVNRKVKGKMTTWKTCIQLIIHGSHSSHSSVEQPNLGVVPSSYVESDHKLEV